MRRIRSRKTDKPIVLNGDLTQWSFAEGVTFTAPPLGGHARQATVHTLWDDQHLYITFDVLTPQLQASVREHDGDGLWMDEGVEFLLDPGMHRTTAFLPDDFAYHINILNAVYDDRGTLSGVPDPVWNGTASHAVQIVDGHRYIIEAAVPWREIGFKPREGLTLGADFCVNGRDPETGEYVYFDWCGLSAFHDPSGFGELVLTDP